MEAAAAVLPFLLDERLRPLAPTFLELQLVEASLEERETILLALQEAIGDGPVNAAMDAQARQSAALAHEGQYDE